MRKLALVLSLISTLFAGIVFGGTFNVVVYPQNREIASYIDAFFPKADPDSKRLSAREERLLAAILRQKGDKLAEAYKTEDEQIIQSSREEYLNSALSEDECSFDVNLIDSSNLGYDVQKLISGDTKLLEYICLENDADLIVVPSVFRIDGFYHMSLYCYAYGDNSIDLVFESVSPDSDMFTVQSMLRLSHYFYKDFTPAILKLDMMVDGSEVVIDSNVLRYVDSYVMTNAGQHIVQISALGHSPRVISIDAPGDSVSLFDASLSALLHSDLMVRSNPDSDVYIDGKIIGHTPLMLQSYSLPLSIRFEKDLHMGRTVGITQSTGGISVDLKPYWMGSEGILKQKKDAFYWAFARSFLLFGAKLALGVFNDGSNKVLSSLDIVSNGLITVSVVDAVGRLIDYFRQTEYISP